MKRTVRGALAGLGATILMSLVMLAGESLGLVSEQPPREITKRAEQGAGVHREDDTFGLRWIVAHFGYGMVCGAVFGIVRRIIPGGAIVSGTLFGMLLWAVNYLGVLPALKLYPWPDEDRDSRTAVMIAAHEVYGVSLARLTGR